jgi:hypothetical protein
LGSAIKCPDALKHVGAWKQVESADTEPQSLSYPDVQENLRQKQLARAFLSPRLSFGASIRIISLFGKFVPASEALPSRGTFVRRNDLFCEEIARQARSMEETSTRYAEK